ncbi:hypothetical protein DOY81_007094 [Sarcophaga bullata]|nr:hypothetical protein DOY81_007094 [Sarcophaga bullata]
MFIHLNYDNKYCQTQTTELPYRSLLSHLHLILDLPVFAILFGPTFQCHGKTKMSVAAREQHRQHKQKREMKDKKRDSGVYIGCLKLD